MVVFGFSVGFVAIEKLPVSSRCLSGRSAGAFLDNLDETLSRMAEFASREEAEEYAKGDPVRTKRHRHELVYPGVGQCPQVRFHATEGSCCSEPDGLS